jgi:NAD(P)-dependent dehydrogenase (short-subunit alcohol dehydrogenase family)
VQSSGRRKSAPLAPPKVKAPAKKRKAKASPTPVAIATDGLPLAISRALAMHAVVVAVLYDPQARTDAISTAEAKAGAALAHAGYVPVNVLRRSEIQAIAEQLRVIHAPTVLVFRRPSAGQPALYVQLTGFADKETVAQAAQNAAG